jgi:hypothetical protein
LLSFWESWLQSYNFFFIPRKKTEKSINIIAIYGRYHPWKSWSKESGNLGMACAKAQFWATPIMPRWGTLFKGRYAQNYKKGNDIAVDLRR